MTLRASRAAALRLAATLVAAAVLVQACGGSTPPNIKSTQRGNPKDKGGVIEEKPFKEIEAALPPYPQEADLLEFKLRRNSPNRYYVDRTSISIGEDRVIRYSAVVKSPSGVNNTSYEAMRCKTSEYKTYAFGVKDGEWANVPDVQWRPILIDSLNFRYTLFKDYFCDLEAIAGSNEKDLVANVRGNQLNNVSDKNR